MNFLKIEIFEGVQKLSALRLRNTPSAETLRPVAEIWCQAFESYPVAWNEEQDRERLKAMFVSCSATCEEFPSPAVAYRLLKTREQRLALARPVSNTMSEQNKKMLSDLMSKLTRKMTVKKTNTDF